MSESVKTKSASREPDAPSRKGPDGTTNKTKFKPVKDKKDDSKAIERAVYDGMQDLRVKKSR